MAIGKQTKRLTTANLQYDIFKTTVDSSLALVVGSPVTAGHNAYSTLVDNLVRILNALYFKNKRVRVPPPAHFSLLNLEVKVGRDYTNSLVADLKFALDKPLFSNTRQSSDYVYSLELTSTPLDEFVL